MSSFFGKDESEKNLQYDDIAFVHFLLSACGAVAICLTISILIDIFSIKRKPYGKLKKSGIFNKQLTNAQKKHGSYFMSSSFCVKFFILIGVIAVVSGCSYIVNTQDGKMIGFDPY